MIMSTAETQKNRIHKILVADDSATDFHYFNKILARNGFEVLLAKTGEEAIEAAINEQPDVVLMDVVMPGMSGYQATREILRNEKTMHIPVIMVSFKGQETDRLWGLRQGAVDYLIKPVPEKKLINLIRSL